MSDTERRLVVVSNRLPIRIFEEEGGGKSVRVSPGGLVTALTPILERQRGTWIGWVGGEEDDEIRGLIRQASDDLPYDIKSVPLSEGEVETYYRGFSNETIWPLFHDLLGYAKFEKPNWESYFEINERFARKAAEAVESSSDLIWIQDYQLLLVAHHLRRMGIENPLAHFLHIPFPTPDLFRRLPWRREVIKGLLKFDLLGFQTLRDRRNFVACVRDMQPNARIEIGRRVTSITSDGGRVVKIGNWPISIDYNDFNQAASSREAAQAAWYFHEHYERRKIVLGVDRLDYTKGIPERMLAFERLLEKYPECRGKVCLHQIVVPSRTHVPDYQDLKSLLDTLVGRINGRFTAPGYVPIHYLYRSLNRVDLIGRYKASEIALITPLRDGMNLVCKEYCASKTDNEGILVLSEFAGAAEQMAKGALMVNPFDQEGVVDALHRAISMPYQERIERMQRLRAEVRRNDVHRWAAGLLGALN
ncbi:MAG: trehalose-6-phosphate synthase [Sumerlaeia bacterium]